MLVEVQPLKEKGDANGAHMESDTQNVCWEITTESES